KVLAALEAGADPPGCFTAFITQGPPFPPRGNPAPLETPERRGPPRLPGPPAPPRPHIPPSDRAGLPLPRRAAVSLTGCVRPARYTWCAGSAAEAMAGKRCHRVQNSPAKGASDESGQQGQPHEERNEPSAAPRRHRVRPYP